jgi:predicted RNA-binding Zn-ribbon protein involved in translation (DUF1610 family)
MSRAAAASTAAVYECPGCGERQTTRRCEDCNLFTRRLGPGGECPNCGELVLTGELLEAQQGTR